MKQLFFFRSSGAPKKISALQIFIDTKAGEHMKKDPSVSYS